MSNAKFSQINYTLTTLLDGIELGSIGLPDIQRPFVWSNTKIRNLFDSMYRGYPVGYFLFWQTGAELKTRTIGTQQEQIVPQMLIVDGQQRLTSLFAVLKGIRVVDEDYKKRKIEIAFRPSDEQFAVANAASKNDPEFIPDISRLWEKGGNIFSFVGSFLKNLSEHREKNGKSLDAEEESLIQTRINQIYSLSQYPFTALVLSEKAEPEEVSEVFVRINSEGKTLDQADFILTLMSVYWDEGRRELEDYCRAAKQPSTESANPFNHFLQPSPDQLLRLGVGLGFNRAVLKYAYALLRGKDLATSESSPEIREKQFATLKDAQKQVLNLQNWHDFFKVIQQAGFRSGKMISSKNAILYSQIFYLLGKCQYKVDKFKLAQVIARWFFMVSITGRYSSSPESVMERDLRDISQSADPDTFVAWIDAKIDSTFTNDFWNIALPNMLVTAAASGPAHYAYYAALNLLDARVLFSQKRVFDLLDPSLNAIRAGAEKHHLFPRKHLEDAGISQQRERNQLANYALVEWDDNNAISASAPADYVLEYESRFSDDDLNKMYYWHALPVNWHQMEYSEFLKARRKLIAKVIQDGYRKLESKGHKEPVLGVVAVDKIVAQGEGNGIEFKSTLRVNLHTNQNDVKMEHSVLKTIAAFLNTSGGFLVIGVDDSGNALGIDADKFSNEDKMNLHLVNIIKERLGTQHMLNIQPHFCDFGGKRVLVLECKAGYAPAYLKQKDGSEQFFVRTGAATSELLPSQIHTYVNQRF